MPYKIKQFSHKTLINIHKKRKFVLEKKNKKLYLEIFKFINFFKLIEEALEKRYHPYDEMKCPVHFAHGQECVPAALSILIKNSDYLFSHHRSHGYYLAKKCPLDNLFAELYGKETGANGGIAGSQDISFEKKKFFSGAILAGGISIAVGTALSLKLRKSKNLVFCSFGESATDQGIFWESLNYSSLKNLPILFICENNNLSVLTPQNKRQSGSSISDKSKIFGVDSVQIFGNDPIEAYNEIKKAVQFIKKKQKPFLIEAFTFRTMSHVGPLSDDLSGLKNTKEFKFWTKNNPRDEFKKLLIKNKFLSEKEFKHINNSAEMKIKNSFDFAKKSKYPNLNDIEKINFNIKKCRTKNKLKKLEKNNYNFGQKIIQVKGY